MSEETPEVELGLEDYAALFDLAPRHTLRLGAGTRSRRGDVLRETRWLDEHDIDTRLVACYRTWRVRQGTPPRRTEFGWERFSTRGELLDREVRYSTRAGIDALH